MTNASGRNDFSALSLSYGAGEGTHTPSAAGESTARYINRDGVEHFENDGYQSYEESERAEIARRGGDSAFMVIDQSGRVIQPGAGVRPDDIIRA